MVFFAIIIAFPIMMEVVMSIKKLTELQDLKAKEQEILNVINTKFEQHRKATHRNIISEMRKYLEDNGFNTKYRDDNRSFDADYKGIKISATSSKDDESYFGADYVIVLVSGNKKAEISISVGRVAYPDQPHYDDFDALITDYKNNYLPALQKAAEHPVNDTHKLVFKNLSQKQVTNKIVSNASEAVEDFCSLLV